MANIRGIKIGGVSLTQSLSKKGDYTKEVSAEYICETTKVGFEGVQEALDATPPIGAVFAYDTTMTLSNKRVRQDSSKPNLFYVTCDFSVQISLQQSGQQPPQFGDPSIPPLSRPPVYNFSTELVEQPITKDAMDKPVVNTAGQPFDPPLTRYKPLLNFTISINVHPSKFRPVRFLSFAGKINGTQWLGFKQGTVMFLEFSGGEIRYEMEQYFVPTTFSFKVDQEGWVPVKVLNVGTVYWTQDCECNDKFQIVNPGQGNCRKIATTQEGFVTSDRVFLDLCGRFSHQPFYLHFYPFKFADFNELFLIAGR